MLAPNGIGAVLKSVHYLSPAAFDGVAITGPWAAHEFAPLATGGQLILYVADWLDLEDLADQLGLLPVEENADVLLLRAPDRFVFERPLRISGIQYVALSQLVLDCLAGPGRMPAEGEAILEYMSDHLDLWQASSIQQAHSKQQL